MKKIKIFVCLFCLLSFNYFGVAQQGREVKEIKWENEYPEPATSQQTESWGKHIQRTMHLLASSTPQKRNTVRVLFYGQSIVANKKWTDAVVFDLKKRFPHANIIYENRAIGGFSSQYLVQSAEADLYPFYPDLLIFHVYGSHKEYQEIIHNTRSRTTAEIAIVSDHLGSKEYDGKEFYSPGDWKEFKRNTFVPLVAEEYDAQLIDITAPWKEYLVTNNLTSQDLLKDGVHPNDHGCYLMSTLVARELVYLPEQQPLEKYQNIVRDYEVGKDVKFEKGKLILEFSGNRVDLIAADQENNAALEVFVDGKKPSQMINSYYHGRSSGCPGVAWPAVLRVDAQTLPLLEKWTLTIKKVNEANTDFTFQIEGSKTGFDGTGSSLEQFISNSGRVVIEPKAWMNLERDYKHKGVPVTKGFKIHWQTKPLFVDQYQSPENIDQSIERATTVVQNIANKSHTLILKISKNETVPIAKIRIYEPPLKNKMKVVADPPVN
jgi:hypothetical protein